MPPSEPTSPAEYRVLRWFLALFFTLAVVLIGATWWQKSSECAKTCKAQG